MSNLDPRAFLKASAVAAGACFPAFARTEASAIRAFRTSGSKRFQPMEQPLWQSGAAVAAQSIRIDSGQLYQQVFGFGAALTDESWCLLEQLNPAARTAILDECVGPQACAFLSPAPPLDPATIRLPLQL